MESQPILFTSERNEKSAAELKSMKLNTIKHLQAAEKLISHLLAWGSITVHELSSFSCGAEWLDVLLHAGIVEEHKSSERKPTDWSLSKGARGLLNKDSKKCDENSSFSSQGVSNVSYRYHRRRTCPGS
jgi:hypothetical protein